MATSTARGTMESTEILGHISDHDLDRYHLGMIVEDTELATVEEHILACPGCAERAEETAYYIDMIRAALINGDHDL